MKIRYNGHSCFSIFSKDGQCIVIDPYQPGGYGGAIGYLPIDSKPDVVLITHNHPDHNYTNQFKNEFELFRGTGKGKGFAFQAIDAFHDGASGSERGKIKIFKFEVDGVRVCHLGDLGQVLTAKQIEQIGEVDVLLVPVGGYYTIDANEATDTCERVRPKIAIPMHYKTEKCGFDIAPVGDFLKGKSNVKKIESDEIELTPEKLPGEPEIIVLKHRL